MLFNNYYRYLKIPLELDNEHLKQYTIYLIILKLES